MKKTRILFDIIRIFVFLVALSVLLYPTVSNYLYEKNSSRAISLYDEAAAKLSRERRQALLEEARAYNARLVGNTSVEGDTFETSKEETSAEYSQLLNMDSSGMMGSVIIPEIDEELPIYHTTSEAVLQKGVGHFPSSSLPVGGDSTHAVLTGHRGLPSKKLFTDLDKIVEGDVFYIRILEETLAYQVDQILTVLPQETQALQIEEGKDYVTLVTCTPYAVNTHRLLIRGHRIPYEDAEKIDPPQIDTGLKIPYEIQVLLTGLGVLVLIIIIWKISGKVRKKKK
ncbi:class C sortase [Blautia sp. An249]|uniref:class C sortase n=1 Tax=Blautia sp. An249 TaxID=1965603 RepID=UPI000B37BB38|nr:class C sortase [Blautia sp. An249]OUO78330.1 class C sortase [Blautia sp. An249]